MALFKNIKSLFEKKAVVLMYHRIATVDYDPSRLCVSQENFEGQVAMLKKYFGVISVPELVNELKAKRFLKNAVCITFDDGYADNFLFAKPILERYSCPATFFIATNFIGSGQLFWWDLLEEIILGSVKLPPFISLQLKESNFSYSIKEPVLTPQQISEQKNWHWPAEPPNERCKLLLALWELLLPLKYHELLPHINTIAAWAGYNPRPKNEKVPMTMEQLKTLSSNNLFHLGIHTSTHPALPFHEKDFQLEEIKTCKIYLRQHFKHTLNAMAFPYGRYNDGTLQSMKETAVEAGFTTIGKTIVAQSDILTLGRMQVCDWKAPELYRRVKRGLN
jgi:peptidoglycan/xylan/chitin deacetylase (PgdA/CDA1 family)